MIHQQVSRFQQLFDSISGKHGGRGSGSRGVWPREPRVMPCPAGIRFEHLVYIIVQMGIVTKGRADEVRQIRA